MFSVISKAKTYYVLAFPVGKGDRPHIAVDEGYATPHFPSYN